MQTGKLQIMKAMKLYRINIKNLEDPLENPGLLEMVGVERRKKVLRYYRTDDRKRSIGVGIIILSLIHIYTKTRRIRIRNWMISVTDLEDTLHLWELEGKMSCPF